MGKENIVKEITNIEDDFSKWYTDIVVKSGLADYTDTKGCIVIKPYGYKIWENIQKYIDEEFKKIGIENVYFPLLINESLLQKEKDHVEGFAPEVAWVTHAGENKLDERLCIRPTSETIITSMYSKWLNSWRELPFLYNQWCNVLRWEKETRPFLRSREFLWQEGHTIHETAEEARSLTLNVLDIYTDVLENLLSIPVVRGLKTNKEKFAGALETYTVEALMYDGKALQSGTSHYFGQNFTKPFNVKFQNREGKEEYAYQTSFGVTTRLIGGIIMSHGDNRGLKLPPKVAPIQVVILPIKLNSEEVVNASKKIYDTLSKKCRVKVDERDQYSVGYKFNDWEMKGVPIRIEIGPRDLENDSVTVVRRDTLEKISLPINEIDKITDMLDDIQKNMFDICLKRNNSKTSTATNMNEFKKAIDENLGYIEAMWCGDENCEEKIKEETGVKSRCIPFDEKHISDTCVYCGKKAKHMVVWGKQY